MKSKIALERDYDRFISAYIDTDNSVSKAAKKIGITCNTATSWLKSEYVQNKINEFKRVLVKNLVITKNDVLSELWKISTNYNVEEKYRIEAMKEINKMLDFLASTKIDVNSTERKLSAVFVLPANSSQSEKWQGDIKNLIDLSNQRAIENKIIDMENK